MKTGDGEKHWGTFQIEPSNSHCGKKMSGELHNRKVPRQVHQPDADVPKNKQLAMRVQNSR